jgi:hypothetical protein
MIHNISKIKKLYIEHPRYENLSVIPYSRGRLNFAALTARAIQEDRFDTVLVDLPYFMNSENLLKESSKLFPLCHSLMIKKDKAYFMLFPFTPNDAACAAVAAVQILKDMGISNVTVKCIDDSHIINYPQEGFLQNEAYLKDDSFVLKEGPKKYFEHLFWQLESAWNDYPEKTKFFCEHRAGLVAQRIAEEAEKGKKVLFVCEWRLWWLVSKKLELEQLGRENFFLPDWKDLDAAVVLEDPLLFWAKGMLDDFPAVVARFYSNVKLFSLKSFYKLQVIDEFIKNSVDGSVLEKAGNVSVRKIISFHNYLRNRLTFDLRVCPYPVSHLFDAAYSCVGKKYARELARLLLDYPRPRRWQIKGFLIIREGSADRSTVGFEVSPSEIEGYLLTGTSQYTYDRFSETDRDQSFEDRLKIANTICPIIDPKEAEAMGRGGFGLKWAIQEDYHLHEIACRKVRDIVNRLKRLHKIERSWGSMGEGIDWKGTIASKASGENAIYIKRKMHYAKEKQSRFDEYTPVTFLFTDDFKGHLSSTIFDANKSLRNKNLGNKNFPYDQSPPEDLVYSIFYTFTQETDLYRGNFLKVRLSSITLLYTIHVMGDVRYERIMRKPSRFHCRMQPYSDPELYDFPLSELGIAWGVKYAEHTVLVAAKEGWKPLKNLSEFAKRKRVQITPVTFSSFSPDFIDRLRELFFSSTALKKHHDRDKIVKRYL